MVVFHTLPFFRVQNPTTSNKVFDIKLVLKDNANKSEVANLRLTALSRNFEAVTSKFFVFEVYECYFMSKSPSWPVWFLIDKSTSLRQPLAQSAICAPR